ncbi:ParB/RepB/Spo0J family partition protein [Streptomyces sp. NBC_00989]|uniref:ParB/RepB/Spo0J family partition protein n=1 Tax=Streptomyces sp. NBC_00989 TaxID=2903705 RepID=UPI00386945B2|nr:ParB/RepB/Spo0J family partition protein [Streptomyces sp. NBC_00989]
MTALRLATCTYQEFTPDMGIPVRTTVGRPRWRLPYELAGHAKTLTPTRDLLKIEAEDAYEAGYRALLTTRGIDAIRAELEEIAAQYESGRLVFLCFDKLSVANNWCHRSYAARYLSEHMGLTIPELGACTAPARPAPRPKAVEPAKVSNQREVLANKVTETRARSKTVQKVIPIDRIDRDPTQPRKVFDQAKLEELAGSIKKLGLLQPVSVRYVPSTKRYVLIAGERRWRSSQMAGLTEMPAVVNHGVQDGDREILAKQVAENVGRADMTPIEEAESFKRLTDAEYTIDEVSEMVGKSAAYVGWRIDLLRLCEPAQEALSKGYLTVGLAWYVSLLNCDNQMRFLTRHARGEFRSARDAEAFAQAARTEEKRQEEQGSFFVLADEAPTGKTGAQDALPGPLDVPSEERERIAADRNALVRKIDRLSAAGEILSALAGADPEGLALLLAGTPGGVPGHAQRMEHLRDLTLRATKNLRQAQAIASVRASGLRINPEAVTSSSAA